MKKLVVFLLVVTGLMYAGDPSRKGTTGAEQLLIPVGARSIATGGAFLSNTTGAEALYYNPAGLDVGGRSEAMFSYMSYIADINISYFALAAKLGDLGTFGFSYKAIDMGKIPVTTNEAPDGTGATFAPSFYTMGLSYGKIITDRVSVGMNAKFVHEGIMNAAATGFGIDFGVQYRFPSNLSLGVAVKNIGTNMSYSGADLQVKTSIPGTGLGYSREGSFEPVTETYEMPSYFELSMAYDYKINNEQGLLAGASFRNNNQSEDRVVFGLEYDFSKMFFVRGGYDYMLENSSESIYGLTAGAGVKYDFEGIDMSLDYAYRDVKTFSANHIFTLKLGL